MIIQKKSAAPFKSEAIIVVTILVVTQTLLMGISSVTHLDFARDVSLSMKIVEGSFFPMEGPVLAGTIHFGPLWYYLLAVPQLFSDSWLAITFFIGFLASMKYFLAYRVGTELAGPLTGILWALLLAFPSWLNYGQLFLSHTSFIEACTLLTVYFSIKLWRKPSSLTLAGLSFSVALALHAHPSCITLFLVGLCITALLTIQRRLRFTSLLYGAFSFCLLFSPVIYNEFINGFVNFRSGSAFVSGQSNKGGLGQVSDTLRFVEGIFTGPKIAATDLFQWPIVAGNALTATYILIILAGLAGSLYALTSSRYRVTLPVAIFALCATILITVLLRNITPYYMTFSILTLLMGLTAWGITYITADIGQGKKISLRFFLIPLLLPIIIMQYLAGLTLYRGEFRFSFFPLFDIKQSFVIGKRLPIETSWEMSLSGQWLCDIRDVAVQGALPYIALHSYGLNTRKICHNYPKIFLGGQAPQGTLPIIGLARPMLKALNIQPDKDFGAIGIFTAARVLHPEQGARLKTSDSFPPVNTELGPAKKFQIAINLPCNEAILISDLYFAFTAPPVTELVLNGKIINPSAEDMISLAYLPSFSCPSENLNSWNITIDTPAPERVGIVSFLTTPSQ